MSANEVDLSSVKSYLLDPAPLSEIISFEDFQKLFPASLRSSPEVVTLYRAAEEQRAKDIAHVANNIAVEETRRSEVLSQASIGLHLEPQTLDRRAQRELDLDRLLANQRGTSFSNAKPQTLKTVLPAMEDACKTLEADILALGQREEKLMEQLRMTVGDLSDLRYGNLPEEPGGGQAADSAADALAALRDTIEQSEPHTK